MTPFGRVPVERLAAGDHVVTHVRTAVEKFATVAAG